MKPNVLLFDLGNVVLTNDWFFGDHPFPAALSKRYGVPMKEIDAGFYTFWPEFKVAKISETTFFKRVLQKTNDPNAVVDDAKQIWRKYQHPIDGMFNLLERLRSHYCIAALSNIAKEWYEYKRDTYHLDEYFDSMTMSWEMGIPKPETGIFLAALKKLAVKSLDCIMIDDDAEVIDTARALGFETIHFTGEIDLEVTLHERGVTISQN